MDKIVSGWIENGFLVLFYPLEVQLVHCNESQPKASNWPTAKRPSTELSDKQTQISMTTQTIPGAVKLKKPLTYDGTMDYETIEA